MDLETFLTMGGVGAAGATIGALTGVMLVLFALAIIALYVYSSMALMTIGKKLKYKYPWLAWIPGANIAMVFQLGRFHWALAFLLLIPILGWIAVYVLTIISMWRIYEQRKYPGWLSLIMIATWIPFISWIAGVAHLVVIGLVAWKDNK